jgi:hypothetical protein
LFAESPVTVAVNVVAAFSATVAVVGATATATVVGVEPPPPGGAVELLDPPPQPVTKIVMSAATAHIRRQPRCLCARTINTSPVCWFSRWPVFGFFFEASGDRKATSMRVSHHYRRHPSAALVFAVALFLRIHAAVGNRDFPQNNGISLSFASNTLSNRPNER